MEGTIHNLILRFYNPHNKLTIPFPQKLYPANPNPSEIYKYFVYVLFLYFYLTICFRVSKIS